MFTVSEIRNYFDMRIYKEDVISQRRLFKYILASIVEYFSLFTLWLCHFLVRLLNNVRFVGQ